MFGIVADTAKNRTEDRELDFISGVRESIFTLLTIASKAAPRRSIFKANQNKRKETMTKCS